MKVEKYGMNKTKAFDGLICEFNLRFNYKLF